MRKSNKEEVSIKEISIVQNPTADVFIKNLHGGRWPKLYCIVGKSGSGKNYFCDRMGLRSIPSYTTRKKRPGELEGREHKFRTVPFFEKLLHSKNVHKKIAAWTNFHNNFYWATLQDVNNPAYEAYIIDVNGVDDFKRYINTHHLVERDVYIVYIKTNVLVRFIRMMKRDVLPKWDWKKETQKTAILSSHDGVHWTDEDKKKSPRRKGECVGLVLAQDAWRVSWRYTTIRGNVCAFFKYLGFIYDGAKSVISRINHDRVAFADFEKKYDVDYIIRG